MTDVLPSFTLDELEAFEPVQVPSFSNDDAVALGEIAVQTIREREANLAVDIVVGDDLVFRAKLGNTGNDNDRWLAAKAAVARQFGKSSYRVKREHEAAGTPFEDRDDVDHETLKAHGGSVPIYVDDQLVATITMSGEPDVVDHAVCVQSLKRYLSQLA